MAQLLFSRHQTPLFQVRLQASQLSIGRSEDCDVVLRERSISRQQAKIFQVEGQFLLKKQGGGPLLVNGVEVKQHRLQDLDKIEMGPWTASFQRVALPLSGEETQHSCVGQESTQAFGPGAKNAAAPQAVKLQVTQPSHGVQYFDLAAGEFFVGADPQSDLVLQDGYVSSRHAKFTYEAGSVWVQDLASTNGTYLGGVRVREGLWQPGEVLKLGQCQFQFVSTPEKSSSNTSAESAAFKAEGRFGDLLGAAPTMKKLYQELDQVAKTEATVLLLGESGSGKELVARAVHQHSLRSEGPFVAVNCGAISRELIESELFGHEKGAFTGAGKSHTGAFGQAQGGTLFLDEIGELPLDLQPKLLRVLENKTYRRVGGTQELKAEVRVVAATHRDLTKWVQEKKFREDLFFRLFVLPIQIPSLRDRLKDIELLAQAFLQEFSPPNGSKSLSEEAKQLLLAHTYPGNVRELRNILMRAVVLSQGEVIEAAEILFPHNLSETEEEAVATSKSDPLSDSANIRKLSELEKEMIERALVKAKGNKQKAAQSLGIAKSTLFSKIKLYQIDAAALK